MVQFHRGRFVLVAGLTLALAGGCGGAPAASLPPADTILAALATGLSQLDTTSLPLNVAWTDANAQLATITSGMDGLTPSVAPGDLTYDKRAATATASLHFDWTLASGDWTYDTTVALTYAADAWQITWSPSLFQPQLTDSNRMVHQRIAPVRADLLGQDGLAIVEDTPVVNVGIDKTLIAPDQLDSSARALAGVVGIDPDNFAAKVLAAGPKAFVLAITLRQYDVPAAVADVPGAYGQASSAMLGPTATFGQPTIGSVHEATADDIAASNGAIVAGDQVGASGIQRYFDATQRGTPGDVVYLAPRGQPVDWTQLPPGDVLYKQDQTPGTPLHLSFDVNLQTKADQVMAGVPGQAAAAIIRPSDGAVLAIANSPDSQSVGDATTGAYAPGSTFKVVTSLALLRQGYTPDTPVNCSYTANINGQIIHNIAMPANGMIPLWQALAWSCNTAFANQYQAVTSANLQDAAGSLGIGIDYTTGGGFSFGTVPTADSDAMRAMTMFGQGGDLMNALDMATVAASVAAGHTVIPWVVAEQKPTSTATPLSADEAASLQLMMGRVITDGVASSMAGVLVGAKTGTAEWGPDDALLTHAWMIGYTANDLAICVWVKDGVSGSATAGPIIKQLLA